MRSPSYFAALLQPLYFYYSKIHVVGFLETFWAREATELRNCLLAEYRAEEFTSAFVQLDSIISHCSGKKPELLPSKSTFSGRNVARLEKAAKIEPIVPYVVLKQVAYGMVGLSKSHRRWNFRDVIWARRYSVPSGRRFCVSALWWEPEDQAV